MTSKRPKKTDVWAVTWDDNRHAQREAALAATPQQRLAWLEEAIRFAYNAGALKSGR